MGVSVRPGVDVVSDATFKVVIENMPEMGFSTFSEVQVSGNTIRYREGNDPMEMGWTKQPGLSDIDNLTLERGAVVDEEYLIEWGANKDRRTVDIVRTDPDGNPIRTIRLYRCYPETYSWGEGDAESEDGYAVEKLVLACEKAESK